jgi:coenzyme PQQ precursor peptide PqqA
VMARGRRVAPWPRVTATCMFVRAWAVYRRDRPAAVVHLFRQESALMTWTKPEFEIVDLCLEVTSYVYRR